MDAFRISPENDESSSASGSIVDFNKDNSNVKTGESSLTNQKSNIPSKNNTSSGRSDFNSSSITSRSGGPSSNSSNGQTEYKNKPVIVKTKYYTDDVVIADYIVTDSNYKADNTGIRDSSTPIQWAINDCYMHGGGTVYLPAGKYRVTEAIYILPFVTLRGDWQDPDTGNDYGTIILADVPSSSDNIPALFTIGGSAGVMGLTVYYPNQDINNVKPYPYTFYIPGSSGGTGYYMLQSIVNCTVINGYKGIGANIIDGAHEMLTVENVKGTFLYRGVTAYNQADVGTWKNVKLSNKYWANAGSGLKKADRSRIDDYTSKNAIGMVLGDLEWTQFANISVEDYSVGINIVKGKRIEFAGSLFGINILRCKTGLKVDSIDRRWGMVVAKGRIEGSVNSIVNETNGTVKLAGVTLSGPTSGNKIVNDCNSLDNITVNYEKKPPKPPSKLFLVSDADDKGKISAASAIQDALNSAGAAGGGIVYLPAGRYKVDAALTIPSNVELRGSSPVAIRDQSGLSLGTTIMAYYGENSSTPNTAKALITLNGKNSGIRGMVIIYPQNCPVNRAVKEYNYTIRGKANGVYAVNMSISAGYNGIDFTGCDNHFIKRLVCCCYNNSISIGNSNGGVIEGCLQNGNVIPRNGYNIPNWFSENDNFSGLFNPITRPNTVFIKVSNAKDQIILNVFAYGVKTLIENNNSTNVMAANIGADNIGDSKPLVNTAGGSMVIVNMMRYNGISYVNSGTALKIINRISISVYNENNISE